MLRSVITVGLASMLLTTPVLAQQTVDVDALFNDPDFTARRGGATTVTGEDTSLITTSSIVDQGSKIITYSNYLKKLSAFSVKQGLDEYVTQEIDQYSGQLGELGRRLRQADVVRISSDEAATAIGASVFAIGKSLRLIGESLSGAGRDKNADGMLQVGQSMVNAAQNLKEIADRARKNGGNVDIAAYERQLAAVDWLLAATRSLDTSMRLKTNVQAKIVSSVSAERGRTYQLISFSGIDSVDERGTIGRNNYFWDFGDGEFQTGAFVTHPFSQANSYIVHLYVLGDSGFGMDTATIKIEPVKPVAVISTDRESLVGPHSDTLTLVQGESVLFSAKNSFDPSDPKRQFEYRWDFGDGTIDDIRSPSVYHAFNDAREYNVVVTVSTKEGLSSVAFKLIRVLPTPPTAVFSVRREGDSLEAGPMKDAFVDHAANPVNLTFSAGKSRGAPIGEEGKYTRLVQATWNFGDGSQEVMQSERELATNQPVRHLFSQPGRYDVTLRLTDDQKSVSTALKAVILLKSDVPTADFTMDAGEEVTTHRQVTFDAAPSRSSYSPIISYSWEKRLVKQDVIEKSATKIFQTNFDAPGTYEIALVTKDASGKESPTVTQRIRVISAAPRPTLAFRRSAEEPNVFDFDASNSSDPDGDTLTYSWDFDSDGTYDEAKLASPTISHLFDSIGKTDVTLRVTDAFNRSTTVTRTVEVDSTLVVRAGVEAGSSQAGPSPLTVNLIGSAYINLAAGRDVNNVRTLAWDFGDGSRASSETLDGSSKVSHTFVSSGGQRSFTVTLTATDAAGNRRRTSLLVVVGQPGEIIPVITLTPEIPVRGTTATEYVFSATGSASAKGLRTGLSADWNFGDGTPIAKDLTTKHRFARAGTYTVTLTLTDDTSGKIGRATRVVEVLREPTVALFFAGPTDGLAPLNVLFDASSSFDPEGAIGQYVWTFGDGAVVKQPSAKITHVYKTPGTYVANMSVTSSDGSKVDGQPVTITVR